MAPKRKATAKDAQPRGTSKGKKTKSAAVRDEDVNKTDEPKASPESTPPSKRETKHESAQTPSKADKQASEGAEEGKDRVDPVTNAKEVPKGVSRDNRGRLVFDDFPDFRPTLTPKQVIQAGSFGGIYFNPTGGRKSMLFPDGVPISPDDFPKDWFQGLSSDQFQGNRYDVKLNKYKVKSGQNQSQWEEQGWIQKDSIDKRGWFQWYCHFTLGRRTNDDERQIGRWMGVAGPKGRWKKRLFNLVKDKGGDVNDASISPVIRQNLLHWAYELTPGDYKALLDGKF